MKTCTKPIVPFANVLFARACAVVYAIMILVWTQLGCDPQPNQPTAPKPQAFDRTYPSAATEPGSQPGVALTKIAEFPRPESLNAMAFSPDGRLLALACGERMSLGSHGRVEVRDLKDGKVLHKTEGRESYEHVVFGPDGKWLLAASYYEVKMWNTKNWKGTAIASNLEVSRIAVAPNGTMLAVSGRLPAFLRPPGILVYDLGNGKKLQTFRGEFLNAVSFSPDGAVLAACSDASITLWDTKTWNIEATFSPPVTAPKATCPVTIHQISILNNKDVFLIDVFTKIHLWNRKHGKELWSAPLAMATVSIGGKRLAGVVWNPKTKTRSLVVRDLPAEEPVATWSLGERYPYSLTLSPKGDRVAWVEINEEDHSADKVFVYRIGQ